jgi:hypothetical protein
MLPKDTPLDIAIPGVVELERLMWLKKTKEVIPDVRADLLDAVSWALYLYVKDELIDALKYG